MEYIEMVNNMAAMSGLVCLTLLLLAGKKYLKSVCF